jgi:MFS family permease
MRNEAGFYVTRGLIGLLEGGFGPLTVMCLSNFYTNKELGFRIAILSSGINVSLLVQYDRSTVSRYMPARLRKPCPLY